MRIYKPRGLNIDESYACSRTAVRKCFEKQDISISWGNPEKYTAGSRRQAAHEGIVVSSLTVKRHRPGAPFRNPNRRPLPMLREGDLHFYIIADPAYDNLQKQTFEESCLPRLRQWYDERIVPELPDGTEKMLVLWSNGRFSFLETR